MNQIIFSTNHPAPYIDRWIKILKTKYTVKTLYRNHKSAYKSWSSPSPYEGKIISNLSLRETIELCKSSQLVILGGWHEKCYLKLLLASKLTNSKVVLFSDYPTLERSWLNIHFKQFFFQNTLNGILCATESTRQIYSNTIRMPNDKLLLFPYLPISEINQANSFNTKNENRKLNIFIANSFYPRKGHDVLYSAFKQLKSNNLLDRFNIVITGNGEEFKHYENLYKKLATNIKILGWVENNEYEQLMADTDIFIHASHFEPFGIPPLDALKCSKLLIVSNGVESTSQLINNSENGFIFKKGDWNQLANILADIAINPSIITTCAQNGHKTFQEHFSESVILQTIEKLF